MQICTRCGKEVKYIATGYKDIAITEVEKIEIITEGGHLMKGYKLHKCELPKEDKKENG
jgi:hypothetical protein